MSSTAHSEFGKIHSMLVKTAENAFVDSTKVEKEWEDLNYLGLPNFEKANKEYQELLKIYEHQGIQLGFLPSGQTSMDSIYCRDASITTDSGIILCNMGKGARNAEPRLQRAYFESNGIKVLGEIQSPGTLEGGDVAWVDSKTLAVGHTYRTNYEGIRQLKELLHPDGIDVFVAEMPHFRGADDVFHLMSVFSPVDKKKAVVYSPLMPIHFREFLLERDYQLIEVPEEEYDSMGCNVLALAPSLCLMVEGNPLTKSRMEKAGCEVINYKGEEISHKGCGGPTCLTRPLLRQSL